jgi:hypothetical protein
LEHKSISDREIAVMSIKQELAEAKALFDEREHTLPTTRRHFER